MPVDLRKLESEGKTLEQIFKDAKGNVDNYDAALGVLMKTTSDLLNLDDERLDKLSAYVETLDDVNESWDKINTFVEENLKFTAEYKYYTGDIRDTLSDIVSEVSTVRTRTNEQVRNVRNLRDLSGELERSLQSRESLNQKSLGSLTRRVNKAVELYEYDVRRAALLSKEDSLVNPTREVQEKILEARRREESIVRGLERQKENAIGREKSEIQALINYHNILIEKLDLENIKKVEGLKSSQQELSSLNKQVLKDTMSANIVAGLGEKFGLRGLESEYQKSVQNQTATKYEKKAAEKGLADAVANEKQLNLEQKGKVNQAESLKERAEKSLHNALPVLAQRRTDLVGQRSLKFEDLGENKQKLELQRSFIEALEAEGQYGEERESIQREINRLLLEQKGIVSDINSLNGEIAKVDDKRKGLEDKRSKAEAEYKNALKSQATVREAGIQKVAVAQGRLTQAAEAEKAAHKGNLGILKEAGVNLVKNLGPATVAVDVILKLWNAFKAVNVDAAELKRRIGSWEIGTAAVNSQLATSVDWLKTATELADFTGLNSVTLFDRNQIASAAEFKNLTGASAAEANNLLVRSRLVGQSTDKYRDSLTKGANEGNRLNRSVVTLREVQQGVLKAGDATALSFGNNAEAMGRAVVAAKNLGMELAGIEKMSDSLLNFESSIANEMEAQLLTGMQLNLSKAREYALENDLEGVATEIQRQGVTAAKFTQMNRIQQEGMAKALGMSREELAKSLILRQLNNGASAEALAAATGMTKEQIEAMNIQQRWQIATQKLAQAFAPIAEVVIDLLDPIAKIVSLIANAVGWLSKGLGHALRLFGLVDKIAIPFGFSERFDKGGKQKSQSGSLESARKAAYFNGDNDKAAELDKQIKANEASMVSFGKSGESAFSKVLEGTGSVLTASLLLGMTFPKLATASANMFKSMITGLGRVATGFVNLGKAVVNPTKTFNSVRWSIRNSWRQGRAGGQNIAKAATAVPGEKVVEQAAKGPAAVAGRSKGLRALGNGIAGFFRAFDSVKMASIGKVLVAGPVLVASLPFMLAVPALAAVGKLAQTGLPALGKGIAGFFRAIGNIPLPALGIAALVVGAITAAAIGIGFALKLAAPAIEAFGNVILKVFQGVGTVVKAASEAFVTGFNGIADALKGMQLGDIGKLALLGPSFMGLAAGLTLAIPGLVAFGLTGLPVLKALSTIIPKLNTSNVSVESKQISQESGKVSEKATKKVETKKETSKTEEKPVDLTVLQDQLSQVIGLLKEGQTIDLDTGKILTSISRTVTSYS